MQPFVRVQGVAAPYPDSNVDTDQIVPARFLLRSRREGFGDVLFHDLRYDEDGKERAEFVLNRPAYRDAVILVTGRNFGCGSSREHAVWALMDHGLRCVVASSFGDIFRNNALKNGLLPVELPDSRIAALLERLEKEAVEVAVDLEAQHLRFDEDAADRFDIDPFAKQCLLEGLSEIDVTLREEARIEAFERRHARRLPWVFAQ
jgi:3-isopropylmalate/(R)-2-methylmalate dehydratase small subunit